MENPNKPTQKPTQEELDWMRASASDWVRASVAEAEDEDIPDEIVDSIVAKGLVVRAAGGMIEPTDVGRKFIIGGC